MGWDLEDLEETLAIVEKDPQRFRIRDGEIAKRKRFVSETKRRSDEITKHLASPAARAKAAKGQRDALMAGGGATSRYAKLEAAAIEQNDAFIEDQGQKQEMIMREQDVQLQEVDQTIGVLKTMGTAIGDELESQNQLLDELDLEMETVGARLKRTMARVDQVLAISKDGKQSCAICLLIIVLIILIAVYIAV